MPAERRALIDVDPSGPESSGAGGTTAAILLAAGRGSRFAGPTHKLLAPLGARRVVDLALDAVVAADLDATYLVVGAVDVEPPPGVHLVRNDRWADGLATSLAAGIASARAQGHTSAVIGLADQPGTTAEAWRRVAAATDTPVAIATYAGERGHPVRLAAEVWDHLPTSGDVGARDLVSGRVVPVTEVPCPGSPSDIDTLEDLTAWS